MMMKMEEPNWFPRWEDELPSPDDLIPLSQSLITPDLALAFDISPTTTSHTISIGPSSTHNHQPPNLDFDSNPTATVPSPDEQPRTLKRPRLVWTPQLHKRFVDAVAHLGIKNAVPKTIMQLMSVDGLTRENVASHLQKYRLYLKRMQGLPNASSHPDAATDHLFASVPHPFLHRPPPSSPLLMGGGISSAGDHHHSQFPPFLHHHMPAAQQYFHHPRHVVSCIGSSPVASFEHGGLAARQPGVVGRFVGLRPPPPLAGGSGSGGGCAYGEDMREKKALTLFPTNVDS